MVHVDRFLEQVWTGHGLGTLEWPGLVVLFVATPAWQSTRVRHFARHTQGKGEVS